MLGQPVVTDERGCGTTEVVVALVDMVGVSRETFKQLLAWHATGIFESLFEPMSWKFVRVVDEEHVLMEVAGDFSPDLACDVDEWRVRAATLMRGERHKPA